MIKKIGLTLIGVIFLTVYAGLAGKLFSGGDNTVYYAQNELMFGSYTLIGTFIFMTIILLIMCNYIIDLLFKKK